MSDEINTGGGGYVGKDATSGADFVSRDKTINNIYQEQARIEQLPDGEKLNLIIGLMMGDKWRNVRGLVDTVADIGVAVTNLTAAVQEERRIRERLAETVKSNQSSVDSKFSSLTMWVWMMLAALGLEGVVLIVLIVGRV
jgi:hypothetical protein